MAKQEKVKETNLTKESGYLYYLKGGNVWRSPMKNNKTGVKGMVEETNVQTDYDNYLYFIDKDGDVARTASARGKK
jgi:hypothetical protein